MFLNRTARTYRYPSPPTNPEVLPFHRTLPSYNCTPLIPLPSLAKSLNIGHILIKDESHRFGLPAFKILGASWATYKAVAAQCNLPLTTSLEDLGLSAREKEIRLVTCTDGNWGRAVSRMAKHLQIPAIIFVPNFMSASTQSKIASEGAQVIVVDGDYDHSISEARKEAEKENRLLVMDVSWPGYEETPQWVVEGYTTMLAETDTQLRDLSIPPVTHAIASVGVGSWAQAVTQHYKSATLAEPALVITVEPDTAASLKTSLEADRITSIATGHTIMDGMNCGTVSYTAWPVLREGVDASVEVTDIEAHRDLQYLLHEHGVKNGPCGAATLSALRRLVKEGVLDLGPNSVVVLFSTEGAREYKAPG